MVGWVGEGSGGPGFGGRSLMLLGKSLPEPRLSNFSLRSLRIAGQGTSSIRLNGREAVPPLQLDGILRSTFGCS